MAGSIRPFAAQAAEAGAGALPVLRRQHPVQVDGEEEVERGHDPEVGDDVGVHIAEVGVARQGPAGLHGAPHAVQEGERGDDLVQQWGGLVWLPELRLDDNTCDPDPHDHQKPNHGGHQRAAGEGGQHHRDGHGTQALADEQEQDEGHIGLHEPAQLERKHDKDEHDHNPQVEHEIEDVVDHPVVLHLHGVHLAHLPQAELLLIDDVVGEGGDGEQEDDGEEDGRQALQQLGAGLLGEVRHPQDLCHEVDAGLRLEDSGVQHRDEGATSNGGPWDPHLIPRCVAH
mmetsp:Transcript_127102/g.219927  ORF Transcript_127102/g.219927 Transcript_127102/m.219927 type:complete len:285 (+) Transcript_127102:1519-2373(+)